MRRVVFIALLLLASCCPKHYPPVVEIRDSIRVEIRERLVHDTVKVEVPKIVEKVITRDTVSHLENEWALSDAALVDGFLSHSLETKGRTVYVPIQVPVHDTVIVEKSAEKEVIEVEVEKPLSWWQRLKIGAFPWLLGGFIALLLWVTRKLWLKLLP